jgi:dihydrofolate reductase
MRRIMMFNRVTADGYFASADGKLDWVIPDAELDKAGTAASPGMDTVLFGRRTYAMFASFWLGVLASGSAADPHNPGRSSPEMQAFARILTDARKIVYSKTLNTADWSNTEFRDELDPGEVEALKAQPGKDVMIFGSGSIVSQLTQHGLIDDYQFIVSPLLLGTGKPLIRDISTRVQLKLAEAKPYASGNVMLRYETVR